MFIVFPKFSDIFPGDDMPSLESVLSKTSSISLLKAAAFMNDQIHLTHSNLASQEESFEKWIMAFDNVTFKLIERNYLIFKNKIIRTGHNVTIFAAAPVLRLIEAIIINFNDQPEEEIKSVDDEMALFQAWLIVNSSFDDQLRVTTQEVGGGLLGFLLTSSASQYEFIQRKSIFYQALLAKEFFEFLENDDELNPFLTSFLRKKSVTTQAEYLKQIIVVYGEAISSGSFGFRISNDNTIAVPFFDSIAHNLSNEPFNNIGPNRNPDPNFKILRNKPLVKEADQSYYYLHKNFFIDKLYQGLIFDFYKFSGIRTRYPGLNDFLAALGQYFAEPKLFYKYFERCFLPAKRLLIAPGNLYNDIEYSDFYVRQDQTLFLIEFKNSMVGFASKQSLNFEVIKAEIKEKLVFDTKNDAAKGISQLIKVIDKIENGGFYFDNLIQKRVGRLNIYPIIVYTDSFFSLGGVQSLISDEFKLLKRQRRVLRHRINDSLLISLEDIINIQYLVQAKKVTFMHIIETYYKRKKAINKRKPRTHAEVLEKFDGFSDIMADLIQPFSDYKAFITDMKSGLGLEN